MPHNHTPTLKLCTFGNFIFLLAHQNINRSTERQTLAEKERKKAANEWKHFENESINSSIIEFNLIFDYIFDGLTLTLYNVSIGILKFQVLFKFNGIFVVYFQVFFKIIDFILGSNFIIGFRVFLTQTVDPCYQVAK